MDTTYNVARSKQPRLGVQELLGSIARGEIDMSRRIAPWTRTKDSPLKLLAPPSAASLIRRISQLL